MEILLKYFVGREEHIHIYHNIDPNSLVIQGNRVYFAHPKCWLSGNCANRYCIKLGGMDYLTCDPDEIEQATIEFDMNHGIYVDSCIRSMCEAPEGPIQAEDGDAE